jgi:hypothetical protein
MGQHPENKTDDYSPRLHHRWFSVHSAINFKILAERFFGLDY